MLLRLVAQGMLTPERFVTHHFTFDSIMDTYDTFGRAAETEGPQGGHHLLTPTVDAPIRVRTPATPHG